MAKKGRVARILTTLHRVAGTPISEALKRRQRAAIQRGDAGTHGGEKSQWKKRKERKLRREQFEGAATQTGLPHGYHSGQRILLVGEGNFSFALALTTLFDSEGTNLLATGLDKTGVARQSYPDMVDIEQSLCATGTGVRFNVDVQEEGMLKKVAKEWWALGNDPEHARDRERGGGRSNGEANTYSSANTSTSGAGPGGFFHGFDRIVWNFPCAGVGTVGRLAVQANQDLLDTFFKESKKLLAKEGEVHVAMADDSNRAQFNAVGVAARAGYAFRAAVDFEPSEFPGYEHFRTLNVGGRVAVGAEDTDDEDTEDIHTVVSPADDDVNVGAKTLIFQIAEPADTKKKTRGRRDKNPGDDEAQ
jgi:25S rRNA (uracil2634-N3)-methyltransferase|tara:strand:+ start:42848 stop:43930 length:1083 start_codon:yes stop_codon:yes gene_type:complete